MTVVGSELWFVLLGCCRGRRSRLRTWAEVVAEGDAARAAARSPGPARYVYYMPDCSSALKEGSGLLAAHGFNIRHGYIGNSCWLRCHQHGCPCGGLGRCPQTYVARVPDVVAVRRCLRGKPGVLSYAKGGRRQASAPALSKTTFTETETTPQYEQAVLKRWRSHLIQLVSRRWVEAGSVSPRSLL